MEVSKIGLYQQLATILLTNSGKRLLIQNNETYEFIFGGALLQPQGKHEFSQRCSLSVSKTIFTHFRLKNPYFMYPTEYSKSVNFRDKNRGGQDQTIFVMFSLPQCDSKS